MVAPTPIRRTNTRVAHIALGFGLATSLGLIAFSLLRTRSTQRAQGHTDDVRDRSLKGTFPASDPPASQYFGIPVNRI